MHCNARIIIAKSHHIKHSIIQSENYRPIFRMDHKNKEKTICSWIRAFCIHKAWFRINKHMPPEIRLEGSSWQFKTYKLSLDSRNEKVQLFNFIELPMTYFWVKRIRNELRSYILFLNNKKGAVSIKLCFIENVKNSHLKYSNFYCFESVFNSDLCNGFPKRFQHGVLYDRNFGEALTFINFDIKFPQNLGMNCYRERQRISGCIRRTILNFLLIFRKRSLNLFYSSLWCHKIQGGLLPRTFYHNNLAYHLH